MTKILILRRFFTILLVAGLAVFPLLAVAQATPPGRVNFQGTVQDSAGTPLNGPVTMVFRLYDDPLAGTLLWQEIYDPTVYPPTVTVSAGLFTVALGDPAHRSAGSEPTFQGVFANHGAVYLGMQAGTDPEMTPRIQVVASPFAVNAAKLEGRQASAFANATHLHPGTDITSAVANATNAAHATTADSATNATNATNAGNSNTVDGKHAADFIPASSLGTFLDTSSTPQTKAGKLTLNGATDYGIDASGPQVGVYGRSPSSGTGVVGNSGTGAGVYGYCFSGGPGVEGYSESGDGVNGRSRGGGGTAGVHGEGLSAGSTAIWGEGFNNGVGGAGYFHGPVIVTGTLTKGGGAFKIDHPLDPSGKYLYHSFVESPDMMNIYNGNVVTDDAGLAEVELPEWFETLNRDFRYQLTVMGRFAQAIVIEKIHGNHFAIKTDKPEVEVSWQVTGIRQDAWANAHRIPVEELKAPEEQGYYLHPDLYGAPEEKGIEWARNPEAMKRLKAERERMRQEPAAAPQLALPASQPVSPSYDHPATGASEPAGGGATIVSNPALPCFPGSEEVEPGDVVVMDLTQKGFVRRCTTLADPLVMGIAAGPAEGCKAGQREEERFAPARVPVASFGIVSCKVDAGYGPIHEGDLLVASPLPGHAMKAQRPIEAGTVIGKALEPLASGTGLIKVLVMFR